jgi:fatty-acyl-CoA synthase
MVVDPVRNGPYRCGIGQHQPRLQKQRTRIRFEQSALPHAGHGACFKTNNYLDTLRQLAPEIDRPGQAGDLTSLKLEHLKHVILLDDLSVPAHEAAKQAVPARAMRFKDFLQQAGPAQHARLKDLSAALDPDDAINIQFTSGTTGHPKGATLSHFNTVNNARFAAKSMALTHEDRVCIPVPLYHCFGMVLGVDLHCCGCGHGVSG